MSWVRTQPAMGRLRHRVTIEAPVFETQPDNSQKIAGWTELDTVWAEVSPLSGREFWDAAQVQSQVTHTIRIRYIAGLTPRHRCLWDQRMFNIESVRDIDERKVFMTLMCREKV